MEESDTSGFLLCLECNIYCKFYFTLNMQVQNYSYACFLTWGGRAPNSNRLNLEAVGVEVDQKGAIKVYLLSLFSLSLPPS